MASTSTPDDTEPQLGDALPGTMDQIKESCDRFRVLVLGKEGVGKSSLINHIFKVNLAKVSEYTAGEADINKEIFSAENDSFVLHDSQGYGSGEVENFRKLTEFIGHRTGNANVGDRLHAIWLCIATPFAGGRVLEAGDEEIFRVVHGKVPIIVVFTRYDNLVMKKERQLHDDKGTRTKDEIHSLARSYAYQSFDKDCIMPMKKANSSVPCVFVSVNPQYEDTLRTLVKTTLHHINPGEHPLPSGSPTNNSDSPKRLARLRTFFKSSKIIETREPIKPINIDAANSVSVMLATAQRVDLDANIRASVSVGHKKYWRGLASGANFMGKDLRRCVEVIHNDIVSIWNFPQLAMLRQNNFRGKVSNLVNGLADQNPSPNANVVQNTTNIAGMAGAITAIAVGSANPVGFVVGPIIAGAVFAKWVYDVYRATPGVLRCFMAYIVDLIIIMQMIFFISEGRPDGIVKREEVDEVLKRFENDHCNDVHEEIRTFVQDTGVFNAVMGKDTVFDKVVELIGRYRAVQHHQAAS